MYHSTAGSILLVVLVITSFPGHKWDGAVSTVHSVELGICTFTIFILIPGVTWLIPVLYWMRRECNVTQFWTVVMQQPINYPRSQIFPMHKRKYCKWWKAGRGLGTRLSITYSEEVFNQLFLHSSIFHLCAPGITLPCLLVRCSTYNMNSWCYQFSRLKSITTS